MREAARGLGRRIGGVFNAVRNRFSRNAAPVAEASSGDS